jgi:hypothetical protein
MDVEMHGMRTALAAAAASILIVVLWGACGCGGSGSSGFDVSASEAQAIARAIDGGACVPFEGQTFCASGITADTDNFDHAAVVIQVPDELICEDSDVTARCAVSLDFTSEGLKRPNTFLAAISNSERGPWTQVSLTVTQDLAGPRKLLITLPVTTSRRRLIAAVMVFPSVPPDTVPRTGKHLADFGADLVYVSPRLQITIPH